jgi:hypothetical protein
MSLEFCLLPTLLSSLPWLSLIPPESERLLRWLLSKKLGSFSTAKLLPAYWAKNGPAKRMNGMKSHATTHCHPEVIIHLKVLTRKFFPFDFTG